MLRTLWAAIVAGAGLLLAHAPAAEALLATGDNVASRSWVSQGEVYEGVLTAHAGKDGCSISNRIGTGRRTSIIGQVLSAPTRQSLTTLCVHSEERPL